MRIYKWLHNTVAHLVAAALAPDEKTARSLIIERLASVGDDGAWLDHPDTELIVMEIGDAPFVICTAC